MALKFSDFNIEQKTLRIERQLVRKGNRIRNTLQIVDNSLIECYPKTSNSVRTIKVPDLILEELNNRREIVEINKRLFIKYTDVLSSKHQARKACRLLPQPYGREKNRHSKRRQRLRFRQNPCLLLCRQHSPQHRRR